MYIRILRNMGFTGHRVDWYLVHIKNVGVMMDIHIIQVVITETCKNRIKAVRFGGWYQCERSRSNSKICVGSEPPSSIPAIKSAKLRWLHALTSCSCSGSSVLPCSAYTARFTQQHWSACDDKLIYEEANRPDNKSR